MKSGVRFSTRSILRSGESNEVPLEGQAKKIDQTLKKIELRNLELETIRIIVSDGQN